MKKILSVIFIMIMLLSSMCMLTGCGNDEKKANANTTEISYTNGKGVFTVAVPKNEDESPKYQFTSEKPEGAKMRGSFYMTTDNAIFTFSTSGLVYNTSTTYRAKYGEVKATFDGYLSWIDDPESKIKLGGFEKFEINGRKAIRYYNRTGSSNSYKYYGYFYAIAADDIYPGSSVEMTVVYKNKEEDQAVEFDEETLAIINSFKLSQNQ